MQPQRKHIISSLFAATTSAQYILDTFSFGHTIPLAPNGDAIPNWHLSGSNHQVQVMSDRLILTPPVPGQTRGALWTDSAVENQADWVAEFEFRASGQEQGSGNLQLWFTPDKSAVGTSSVYTVERFDGLALVVDQYGGRGGGVRGFLNDGTQNYRAHATPESLAFGHCDYSYRNLGRASRLRVASSPARGLSVTIDERECFSSADIVLPASGYYFGVTAATADNPDSFEVLKFVVSSPQASQANTLRSEDPPGRLEKLSRRPGSAEIIADTPPDALSSQTEQFADLHNRLQGMTHQVANLFGELDALAQTLWQRHIEVMDRMPGDEERAQQARRVEGIERTLQQVQRDLAGRDYSGHLRSLQQAVEGANGGLREHLPGQISELKCKAAPRMGLFIVVVVAAQILLAGGYVVYKRRRASAPKKYL